MLTLRCTQRLMRHLDVKPTPEAGDGSEALLGAWYANLIGTDAGPVILCVNEHTRYVIPFQLDPRSEEEVHSLYVQLVWRIHEAMRLRNVEPDIVTQVTDEYRGGMLIAPTASRSVLGTLNDMAMQLKYRITDAADNREPVNLEAMEQKLNQTPILPMKGANPGEMLLERCAAQQSNSRLCRDSPVDCRPARC